MEVKKNGINFFNSVICVFDILIFVIIILSIIFKDDYSYYSEKYDVWYNIFSALICLLVLVNVIYLMMASKIKFKKEQYVYNIIFTSVLLLGAFFMWYLWALYSALEIL